MHQPMKVQLPQQAPQPAMVFLPPEALPLAHVAGGLPQPQLPESLAAKTALPKKVELAAQSVQFEIPGFGGEDEENDQEDLPLVTKTHSLHVPPGLDPPAGSPSHGSVLHGQGNCRPCAWFWKPGSCQNGTSCLHCHACPEGELKARKKAKQTMMRLGLATPKQRFEANGPSYSFFPDNPGKHALPTEQESTTCSGSEQELSTSGSDRDNKASAVGFGRSPRSSPKHRAAIRRSA